jgi:hypothetical protein
MAGSYLQSIRGKRWAVVLVLVGGIAALPFVALNAFFVFGYTADTWGLRAVYVELKQLDFIPTHSARETRLHSFSDVRRLTLVMGKQMSIAFGILLFAVSASHAQSPVPADTVITLRRLTDAFAYFPEYNLTIKADGSVTFKQFPVPSLAKPHPSASGEPIESKISVTTVAALVAEFERVKFFSLRDRYWKNEDDCPGGVWPDFAAAEISIKLNGKSKTIFHYYGCLDKNQRVYPAELDALATKIDTLVNTKQWLK